MILAPVIVRELNAEARSPALVWLRLGSVAAGMVALGFVGLDYDGPAPELGRILFTTLTWVSIGVTLIVAPQLTADSLSREKREGTLGLLFLTPLTPQGVVLAKSLVHLLRTFTALAALAPFFALPMLLGGVSVVDALTALLANLAAALAGLAVGLIATARNIEWMRAMAHALILEAILLVVIIPLFLGPLVISILRSSANRELGRLVGAAVLFAVAAAFYAAMVMVVGSTLKQRWQREMEAPPQPAWTRGLARSAFWQAVFRWNKQRTLDRNPIAWLQEYSWTARLTKWGWLLLAIFGQVFGPRAFLWFLLGGIAFTAAASFRREIHSGVLELLLTTPLRERQIVLGRLWGVVCHFLPAMMVWSVFRCFLGVLSPGLGAAAPDLITLGSSLVTLSLAGFALCFTGMNTILAFLMCLMAGAVLPRWGAGMIAAMAAGTLGPQPWLGPTLLVALQVVVAAAAWFHLRSSLGQRRFLPKPTG